MKSLSAPLTVSRTNWRGIAVAGYGLIFLTFGIVGGWAAVTEIDHAVEASGVVTLETNRKTVQHFEGGIVRDILVKEGGTVEVGATLFRLENVQAKANFDMLENEYCSLLAIETRLLTERDQKEAITWPTEIEDLVRDQPNYSRILTDQVAAFEKRRASLTAQVDVLDSRIKQLTIQISGVHIEQASAEKQVAFIDQELAGLRDLSAKNLIPMTRLLSMERERERLEGTIGGSITDAAKAESTIGEYRIQMQQLREKFQEEIASSLVDARQKLSDLHEKLLVSRDVLRRVAVTAPVEGTIQNLRVFTIGQVIKPGEPLLEIVPRNERLIIEVRFQPSDIDGVYAGQKAEIRFPAFHSRLIPLLMGKLESVSRDRLVDEGSKESYYRGIVVLDKTEIPEELRPRLRAGMPAEVLVASGERTVLSYFVSPLTSTLRKAFIN
jgi:HlyD family secretion protein